MTNLYRISNNVFETQVEDVDEALDNICRSSYGESFVYDTITGACVHNVDYNEYAKVTPSSPQLDQQNYFLR